MSCSLIIQMILNEPAADETVKNMLCAAVSLTTPLPASALPNRVVSASYMRTSYSANGSSAGQPAEVASSGR